MVSLVEADELESIFRWKFPTRIEKWVRKQNIHTVCTIKYKSGNHCWPFWYKAAVLLKFVLSSQGISKDTERLQNLYPKRSPDSPTIRLLLFSFLLFSRRRSGCSFITLTRDLSIVMVSTCAILFQPEFLTYSEFSNFMSNFLIIRSIRMQSSSLGEVPSRLSEGWFIFSPDKNQENNRCGAILAGQLNMGWKL